MIIPDPFWLNVTGTCCAVFGAGISVLGNLVNTIQGKHYDSIFIWTFSSAMVAIWAFGFLMKWWNGGIGVAAILGMNLVFLISNLYGIQRNNSPESLITEMQGK